MNRSFLSFMVPVLVAGLVACAGQIKSEPSGATGDAGSGQTGNGNGGNGGNGNISDGADAGWVTFADGGRTCNVAADCGTNSGASCARTCMDGSNPCDYACSSTHQCVMQGCPEDNAPSGCTPECTGADICVRKQFQGGPLVQVDDAGACPMGRHPQGNVCIPDPTYACVPKPALCGDIFDCSCATSVCTDGYVCTGTTRHEIDCDLDAP